MISSGNPSSVGRATMDEERGRSSFNIREMIYFLDGGKDQTAVCIVLPVPRLRKE